MDLQFEITQVEAQPILTIRTVSEAAKLPEILGAHFGEVYAYIQQCGQQPSGMPFSRYYAMDGNTVDFECGMPVPSPIEGAGRIQAGELPAGSVVTVTHLGSYENLPQTWTALMEFIGRRNLHPAGAPWEVYLTDPSAEPDPSKWRTDIFFPVS